MLDMDVAPTDSTLTVSDPAKQDFESVDAVDDPVDDVVSADKVTIVEL